VPGLPHRGIRGRRRLGGGWLDKNRGGKVSGTKGDGSLAKSEREDSAEWVRGDLEKLWKSVPTGVG